MDVAFVRPPDRDDVGWQAVETLAIRRTLDFAVRLHERGDVRLA